MTKEQLADKLDAYGITYLAAEVRASDVSIEDSAHFTIYEEGERGEEGYGERYAIHTEARGEGGESVTAVYGKLVEPDGGTVWDWRDPELYEIPDDVPDCYEYADDMEKDDSPDIIDAVAADSEYDADWIEGKDEDDSDEWMDNEDNEVD
jgi:hypothetical protein